MISQSLPWEPTVPPTPFSLAKTWKIVSSAGCGKTYTVENCIFELIKNGVRPNEIMYLIYNAAPAAEFRQKLILKGINEEDMRWIGTHHSICLKIAHLGSKNILNLKKWGEEKGMDFSEEDRYDGWNGIMGSLEKKLYEKRTDLDPLEARLYGELLQEETRNKKWTHARYMIHVLTLKQLPPEIKYVFVDEAQDSVLVQWDYYEHLKQLDQVKGLMLVGDDKQSLSGWHGGRGDLFLAFQADRQVCLGRTYRNAPAILKAANQIAHSIRKRSPLTSESAQPFPGQVHEIQSLEDCVPEILKSLHKREQVMVLARNGVWVRRAKVILNEYGIPIESQGRRDLIATIRAMRRVASKPLQTVTLSEILEIFSYDKLKSTPYWDNFARFKRGEFEDVAKAEYALMEGGEPWSGDLALFGMKPRLIEDLNALRDGNNLPEGSWKGVSEDLILEVTRAMTRDGEDHPAVKCSTIHSIKGMECDMVVILKNIVGAVARTEKLDPDDELRVWYVAVTRARSKVIFTQIFQERGMLTRLI